MSTYRVSELLASTHKAFVFEGDRHTISIDFISKPEVASILKRLCSASLPAGSGLSLHLEGLKSLDVLPVIDVFLDGNEVGSMGLYGIAESTAEGLGQDRVFDVAEAFVAACGRDGWSGRKFDLELVAGRPLAGKRLEVGRVEVYYYEF